MRMTFNAAAAAESLIAMQLLHVIANGTHCCPRKKRASLTGKVVKLQLIDRLRGFNLMTRQQVSGSRDSN